MKISPWIAAFVFLVAFTIVTRLFQLGNTPAGFTWDEAALGYVGKMVVTTARDEHGKLLPISFLSFGDHKAPLAIYITGVFTSFFGLSPWATRLPFALAGVGSVMALTAIGARLFHNRWYGLLCGWLLAVSPWHLLFSRVAFESGMALFFFLLMIWGWLEIRNRFAWKWAVLAGAGFIGALYTYHAAKIVAPLFLIFIFWSEWKSNRQWVKQYSRQILTTAAAVVVALSPLLIDALFGGGTERAQQTLILFSDLGLGRKVSSVIAGMMAHFSTQFLIFGNTDTLRHGTGKLGVLTLGHLILLLIGAGALFGRWLEALTMKKTSFIWSWLRKIVAWAEQSQTTAVPASLWLFAAGIGVLPAALGFDIPHANRALLALPALIIIMAYAVKELEHFLPKIAFPALVGMLILIASLEFANFWRFYLSDYRSIASADWLYGYAEAVSLAQSYQQAGKSVKFTNQYGQPEIFFGFYLDIPPEEYRARRFPGLEFGNVTPNDAARFDVLITSPSEQLPVSPSQVVQYLDHSPAFMIYEKN